MLAFRSKMWQTAAKGLRLRGIHSSAARLAAETAAAPGVSKVNLNFYSPYKIIASGQQVDMVTIPGVEGNFGVLPNHVPVIAQLRPGVVSVHDGNEVSNFFVSSGFAIVHKDRTDICTVEVAKTDELDSEAVKKGLAEYTAAATSASNEMDRLKAQVGVEVYSAMSAAIGV
mmetsp:Transcript_6339/g.10938  ORF Transcript_6339/g.10938 Transcript_6339/m.10938 type:complete len:171 (+) Transcript_6339:60-572(+)